MSSLEGNNINVKLEPGIKSADKPTTNITSPDLAGSLNRLRVLTKFNQELNNNVHVLEQEMHEERLKRLRGLASKLKEEKWKYPAGNSCLDKLLSL